MQWLYSLRFILISTLTLTAAVIASVSLTDDPPENIAIYLTPQVRTAALTQPFTVDVIVESPVPVNAFTGEVVLDSEVFEVVKIDYNTSIANLWVDEPWYNRSQNSVYFAGGTTRHGGFVGRGSLLTITLRPIQPGSVTIALADAEILLHDGLGTYAEIGKSLDSVFTATQDAGTTTLRYAPSLSTEIISIASKPRNPDLNDDGLVNFVDMAILMANIASNNLRYDLNNDGTVTTRDFAVIQAYR